jgi:hypothetical protein
MTYCMEFMIHCVMANDVIKFMITKMYDMIATGK